jgi:uncharacterized protein
MMSKFLVRLFVTALCATGGFASPALASGRVALVIGNAAYRAAPALDNPSNDAADLAQALRAIGFDVIERRDATREGMVGALRDFSEHIRGADTALFFYAGHGLQMNGENYLLPVDATIEGAPDVRFGAINLADIQQEMEGPGRANIIVLDACRNNPFAERLSHGGRGVASRGLGRIEATGVGSLVVFSTQPNNVALDGAGRNSPFVSSLLKHVATPGLEVRQMISKVRGDVLQATGQKQVPWDNSSLVGDVYLAGAPGAAPVSTPIAAAMPAQNADASVAIRNTPAAPPPTSAPAGPVEVCDRMVAPLPNFATAEQIQQSQQPRDWNHVLEECLNALQGHQGEARIQYEVGHAYFHLKNYLEALHHYQIAADAGFAAAQSRLGFMFVTGTGVVKDYQRAFDLFTKAAAGGSAAALGNLGEMYSFGAGVKEDEARALALFEKSIEAGNPFALVQTGVAYFNGKGTPRDYNAAAEYFQQAADLHDGYAMKYLALMHERGLLGNPDPVKAAQLRLRAAQEDPDSQTPNVPPPRASAPRAPRPAARHVRIYRYLYFGCNWVWC